MGIGIIKTGQRFDLDGERKYITRLIDKDRIEYEDATSARRQELAQAELLSLYKEGRIVFRGIVDSEHEGRARTRVLSNVLMASVPPIQRKVACLRLHFITKLAGIPTTRARLMPLVKAIWEKLKAPERELLPKCPHASTVARWMKSYREANCNIAALLDQHDLKGNRNRTPQKVLELIEDCVSELYLTPQRRNIASVVLHINDLIDGTNLGLIESERLSHVSNEQVRKYIKRLPAYEVYASRYGKQAADVRFRTTGKGVDAALPLQRAAMDHCRLDLFVVDTASGLPLGRPWLTVILDECTRMVLGYSLSFEAPSALSVMRALRHAILPKDCIEDVSHPWPTWGVMRTLVVDNGVEFHGESLDYAAGQFGIIIQTCPRRKPWFKGKIERFFRTMQADLTSHIPGRTFSSVVERGGYDSSKHAVISLKTLNELVQIWVVDIYHQSNHSSLRQSPAFRWESLIDRVDRHLPDSAEWVNAAFGKPSRRVLGHEGVYFDSLAYNSPELGELRYRLGDRIAVNIITNDEDVGYLYVVCPERKEHIRVPAVDLEYAVGLTRWQHKRCREYAAILSEQTTDRVGLAEARRRIVELIAQDMTTNRRASRVRQARALSMVIASGDQHAASSRLSQKQAKPAVANVLSKPSASRDIPSPSLLAQQSKDDELIELKTSISAQGGSAWF